MEQRKGYTRRKKITTVLAADMTSVQAAALASGIPRSTLRHWMEDPELAIYRQNARAAISEEATVVARLAWEKLGEAIRSGQMEPRDLVLAAGMATDKMQLLQGHATERVETKELLSGFNDHERDQLADEIDRWLAERTDAVAAGAEGGDAQPEVRQ